MSNTESKTEKEFNEKLEIKFLKMAEALRDNCDGSYVGAEDDQIVEILGKKYNLWVCAFWESNFHYEKSWSECIGDE